MEGQQPHPSERVQRRIETSISAVTINRRRIREILDKHEAMYPNTRRIPVFVFPTCLNFYLDARQTHKQMLTLYNPYDFPVRFKVLSTAPNKYTVTDPEGSIGPQACVDIVIRHSFPITANCNVTDKFRVTMQDHVTQQTLGKRDVEATLLPGSEADNSSNDGGDTFESLPHEERSVDRQTMLQYQQARRLDQLKLHQRRPTSRSTAHHLAVLAGVISIVALLLPTRLQIEEETPFPPYLHISENFKLVFAYVLGLVSYVLFSS